MIEATPAQLEAFLRALSKDEYYAEVDTALEALRHRSMFNLIDLVYGWKIDLMIRKSRPFSLEEFARRKQVNLHGVSLFLCSAEDAILSKLEWAKLSQSRRQIEDVAAMIEARWDALDRSYLERWIAALDQTTGWKSAKAIAGF